MSPLMTATVIGIVVALVIVVWAFCWPDAARGEGGHSQAAVRFGEMAIPPITPAAAERSCVMERCTEDRAPFALMCPSHWSVLPRDAQHWLIGAMLRYNEGEGAEEFAFALISACNLVELLHRGEVMHGDTSREEQPWNPDRRALQPGGVR